MSAAKTTAGYTLESCPDREKHTAAPSGYVDWFDFAASMTRKGYAQERCPTCQRWAIWKPKAAR